MFILLLIFLGFIKYSSCFLPKALVSTDEVLKVTKEHQEKVWWHYSFPTTGLYTHPRYFPPRYAFIPHQYTLDVLAPHKGAHIRIVMIDVKSSPDLTKNPLSAHAAHAHTLIKEGLSPKSEVICIYLEKNDKAALIRAVQKAATLNPDILLLNLKLEDTLNPNTPLSQLLMTSLSVFPYVVAAAGNDGHHQLAYPACFPGVTFSVGAFGIKEEPDSYLPTCYVPSFSQREPKKGPTFLAPGVCVLSKVDVDTYLTMSGTSTAASIFASALALFLGEYKGLLSKEELLEVVTASGILPSSTPEWLSSSTAGILDIRTALLMGRIAYKIKKRHKKEPFSRIIGEIKDYFTQTKGASPFTDFTRYARQSAARGLHAHNVHTLRYHTQAVFKRLKVR